MSLGVISIDVFLYLLLKYNLASVFYLTEREEHCLLSFAEQDLNPSTDTCRCMSLEKTFRLSWSNFSLLQ